MIEQEITNIINITQKLFQDIQTNVVEDEDNPFGETLSGFCANGSYLLFLILNNTMNKNIKMVINDFHAFLLLEENYIVDVTACQFFGIKKPILVTHKDNIPKKFEAKYEIDNQFTYDNIKDIIEHLGDKKWEYEQMPYEFANLNEWYQNILNEQTSKFQTQNNTINIATKKIQKNKIKAKIGM